MIITNKKDLPQPFVEMAKSDYEYKPYEYRVTTLLKGVREILLTERHRDEIEMDVSEMMWMLFGTAAHAVLERQKEGDHQFKENRLKEKFGKYTLSGQFDFYDADTRTLTDYKTCSVTKVLKKDYDDWRMQLYIYALLLRKAGFVVNSGEIIAIMKDHSKRKARYDKEYPQLPVQKIRFDFDLIGFSDTEKFISRKFAEIETHQDDSDEALPICTAKERWAKPPEWAVMKKGKKKALRVLYSEDDAQAWLATNGGDSIEYREATSPKCDGYCLCREYCNFYHDYVEGKYDHEIQRTASR